MIVRELATDNRDQPVRAQDPEHYKVEDLYSYEEARKMKPQLVPYIAAEFRARDFDSYRSFVVGGGSRSSKVSEDISSRRKKRAQNTTEYYNGPLEENTFYAVFQRAYVNKVSFEGTPGLNTALSRCISQIFLWKREDLENLFKVSLERSGTSQKLCIASLVGGLSDSLSKIKGCGVEEFRPA